MKHLAFSTGAKLKAGFAIGLAVLILTCAISFRSVRSLRTDSTWVSHTYEVLASLERIGRAVDQARAQRQNYDADGPGHRSRISQALGKPI